MDIETILNSITTPPRRLIAPELDFNHYIPIDLSTANPDLSKVDLSSSSSLSAYIQKILAANQKTIAYGGYLERRNIYQRSLHFNTQTPENERNIHLGIDLWCDENSAVFTPFDGRIHSFKNNTAHGDYGPAIILEHHMHEVRFFTLYGHLTLSSLDNLEVGATVKMGDCVGFLGNSKVNGDYPPHLHFQIIKDLGKHFGDYPGVCSDAELNFYQNNCPDPNLILKL